MVWYSTCIICNHNKIIHLRRRIIGLQCMIQFLQSCMNNNVVPDYSSRRISKIRYCNAINVERAFINDEMVFYSAFMTSLKTRFHKF